MHYRLLSGGRYMDMLFDSRDDVLKFVESHIDKLKTFCTYETGHIYGYAVRVDDIGRTETVLIKHETAGFIWLDTE